MDKETIGIVLKKISREEDPIIKRKKHRRGRKKKWKISDLSDSEKQELRKRGVMRSSIKETRPVAPFNSTSFLMDDREETKEVEEKISCFLRRSQSMNSPPSIEGDSGDEFYESPEESIAEADQLLERDFESQYEQMFKERYSGMCKDELVEQCVELEKTLQSTQEAAADEIARLKAEIESLKQDKDPQTNGLDETSLPSQYHATEL